MNYKLQVTNNAFIAYFAFLGVSCRGAHRQQGEEAVWAELFRGKRA
jgi:hypothetical protein